MLASHCSTSGQGWPMKLNGGTRPVLVELDVELARIGHAGRLLRPLDAGVFFLLLVLVVAFLLLVVAGFLFLRLGLLAAGCGWRAGPGAGFHHRLRLLGRDAGLGRRTTAWLRLSGEQ